jgi:hypothetical protein
LRHPVDKGGWLRSRCRFPDRWDVGRIAPLIVPDAVIVQALQEA